MLFANNIKSQPNQYSKLIEKEDNMKKGNRIYAYRSITIVFITTFFTNSLQRKSEQSYKLYSVVEYYATFVYDGESLFNDAKLCYIILLYIYLTL